MPVSAIREELATEPVCELGHETSMAASLARSGLAVERLKARDVLDAIDDDGRSLVFDEDAFRADLRSRDELITTIKSMASA